MNELRIALIVIALLIIVALVIVGLRRRKPQYRAQPYDSQQDFSKPRNVTADVRQAPVVPVDKTADTSPVNLPSNILVNDAEDDPLFVKRAERKSSAVCDKPSSVPSQNAVQQPAKITPIKPTTTDESLNESLNASQTDSHKVDDSDVVASSNDVVQPQNPALLDYTGEPMIVQLQVLAQVNQTFTGEALEKAFIECGLTYGKKKIYHRVDENGNEWFSVANRVNPGYFSPENMTDFYTDGLIVFALLPGKRPGTEIFDSMAGVARQLAETLGGQVFDSTNSSVSMQSIRFTRDEIAEFERDICMRHG